MTNLRPLGATTLAHVSDPHIIEVYFVELRYEAGTVYYHDDIGSITAVGEDGGSHVWTGVGTFGSIDEIEETEKIEATNVTLRLSGIDATTVDQALVRNYKGRTAIVYWALRNDLTGALYNAPSIEFYGRIDVMAVRYSGDEASVLVTLESEAADWFRTADELYSDSQLQKDYPGDLFLEYLDQMPDTSIHWVKAQTVQFGRGPTGGNDPFLPRYPTSV